MDIVDRINSCRSFAKGQCPHQALMERLYLIYQIFEAEQLLRAKAFCCQCGEWSSHTSSASGRAATQAEVRQCLTPSLSPSFPCATAQEDIARKTNGYEGSGDVNANVASAGTSESPPSPLLSKALPPTD
jgi:hypothetical protein